MPRELSSQDALALLEQLDSDIFGDDIDDEDFRVDNANLQNALPSENNDSYAVEHSANVLPLALGRRKNIPNISDGCSNKKYSSSSCIIWTQMNITCSIFTVGRSTAYNIADIPSGSTHFEYCNTGTSPASAQRLMVNEAMMKYI